MFSVFTSCSVCTRNVEVNSLIFKFKLLISMSKFGGGARSVIYCVLQSVLQSVLLNVLQSVLQSVLLSVLQSVLQRVLQSVLQSVL